MSYAYSADALIAAHTAFRDLLDAGTGAGSIKIRDEAAVLLAQIALESPAGTVDGATGQLSLLPDGREDSAPATGVAHECEICDGDGLVHLTMPCAEGTVPVAGYAVLNTRNIIAGAPVEAILPTIG